MSIFKSICEDINHNPNLSRVSYAGGYQMPKTSEEAKRPRVQNESHHVNAVPKETNLIAAKSDLLSSLNKEISKLRADSNNVAEYRVKFADNPPVTQVSGLDELEKMRLIHKEKLKVIEEEYKKAKSDQQQPKRDVLADYKAYEKEKNPLKFKAFEYKAEPEKPSEIETLLKWLFTKIDVDGSGLVEKHEMLREIIENQELREYFGIENEDDILDGLNELIPADFLSQNDFLKFFLSIRPREKESPEEKISKNKVKDYEKPEFPQDYPIVVLNDRQLKHLERVFQEVDIHHDMAVQKFEYLQSLRTDDDIIKILDCNAVEISKGCFVTLEEIIDKIQDGEDLYEYITYSQFLNYLYLMFPKQTWKPEEIQTNINLDPLYIQILQDIFDSLPRKTKGFVSTRLLIDSLKEDPQVQVFLSEIVKEGKTVENILQKINKEFASTIEWNDFIEYFSEKERPALKLQEGGEVNRGNYYALKQDFAKHSVDPEANEKPKFQYEFIKRGKPDISKQKVNSLKFTVPAPFNFDSREKSKSKSTRQLKFEKYVNEIKQEEENHLKYRPKPVTVPAEVIVPKYNTMLAAQEARRNEVKENSKKITKDREQPFAFYLREMNKPKPTEIKEVPYQFKAKPPPPTNSIPLYEQMSRKLEEDRKSRIESAARKALEEAKLPPRMERFTKGDKNLSQPPPQSTQFKAKKPPEFTKLWDNLGKALEKKKQNFQPTTVKEFNFSEVKKKSTEENNIDEELMRKGFTEIVKKKSLCLDPPKDLPKPTKKQLENELNAKKRREEQKKIADDLEIAEENEKTAQEEAKRKQQARINRDNEESKKRALEGKDNLNKKDEKYLEDKERMMERVKNRPSPADMVSSEYSRLNNQPRTLTLIKQKMMSRGIAASQIIGEEDMFIDVIAEDLV